MQFNGSISLLVYRKCILHQFLVIVFNLIDLMFSMFYNHPSLSFFLMFVSLIIYEIYKNGLTCLNLYKLF